MKHTLLLATNSDGFAQLSVGTTLYNLPTRSVLIWIYDSPSTIQEETRNKPLRSMWVPSHTDRAKAETKEERMEVILLSMRVQYLLQLENGS